VPRAALAALAIAFVLVWFGGLGYRKLARPDEGRYGEIPREMVASGDWLTPRANGYKYFEKPPLQYWATAAAFSIFGVHEWTTRFWTALTGFIGILLTFYAGNRVFGPPVGLHAAAVLAGSAIYALAGHFTTLDMGVSFFLALAVFVIAVAQLDGTKDRARRRWMLAAWAAMALAVLSKGLIGIVLPAGAIAIYVVWQRDWRLLHRLNAGPGIALFLAIAAPWFIAVSVANPEFARFFFFHEHIERFLTKQHGRSQPFWYFAPVLLGGILPWLPMLPVAVWRARVGTGSDHFSPSRFLLVWCATVFVFFSASGSKLPGYILPIFPVLAVLIAVQLPRIPRVLMASHYALVAVCGCAVLWFALHSERLRIEGAYAALAGMYAPWIAAAGGLLAALALAALWFAWRGFALLSVITLAAGSLGATQLAILGNEAFAPLRSAYHIVEMARPALKRDAPFFAVDLYDHTLPFYLGRTITMVAYRDELTRSIDWEPKGYLPNLSEFAAVWSRARDACGAFVAGDFKRIRDEFGLEARVVASDMRYVIACKP
jgi:4-amino-4-deoxy-L-arabinose transferase-like glycosyltransferase